MTPAIRSWTLFSHSLGPVSFSLNAVFFIGVLLMLMTFAIQHRGILGTANVQKVVGLLVIIPMLIVGVVPIITGQINWDNYTPLAPLKAAYAPEIGAWDIGGWTLVLGGMFIAAWSTYGFETAVCYTREFKNPKTDTFKAIFYSGMLCLLVYILVPFSFQGVLGLEGMLATPIVDGSGVAEAMGNMVGGGGFVTSIFVMLMILALILAIMTAMAGTSRTLYQGSIDGWLPKYLSHVNEHGAPTRAMWTDLVFNLFLLAIAAADATSYFFILAVSNCCYIIFNFLNLNSGWIHRIDNGHVERPYKAPTILLVLGHDLCLRQRHVHGRRRESLEPDGSLGRLDRGVPDHPGVLLPALHPGQGRVPRPHAGGPERHGSGSEGAQGRHAAVHHAHRRPDRRAGIELVLPASRLVYRWRDHLDPATVSCCQSRAADLEETMTEPMLSRPRYPGLSADPFAKLNLIACEGEGAGAVLDLAAKAPEGFFSRAAILFCATGTSGEHLPDQA